MWVIYYRTNTLRVKIGQINHILSIHIDETKPFPTFWEMGFIKSPHSDCAMKLEGIILRLKIQAEHNFFIVNSLPSD